MLCACGKGGGRRCERRDGGDDEGEEHECAASAAAAGRAEEIGHFVGLFVGCMKNNNVGFEFGMRVVLSQQYW